MGSRFRTVTADGQEQYLDDVQAVVGALREGLIRPDSLLFDANHQRWIRADQHDAVQAATAAMDFRSPQAGGAVSTLEPAPEPTHTTAPPAPPAPPALTEQRLVAEPVLERLRAYVGPNWDPHYAKPFGRLLGAREGHEGAGWTWNWPAALIPLWFLYRRLYLAFSGFLALYLLLAALGGVGVLPLMVLTGFLGDRLLFRKAYRVATALETPTDPARLQALGKPHRWVLWVPLAIVVVGMLFAIIAPTLMRARVI